MFVAHQDVAERVADGKKDGGGQHDAGHKDDVLLHLWCGGSENEWDEPIHKYKENDGEDGDV